MNDLTENNKANGSRIVPLTKRLKSAFQIILRSTLIKYFFSALIIVVSGIALYVIHPHIGYQSVSLIFLFIISLLPLLNFKPGPIFLAAVMSALIWNFYFIPPYYTFRIGKVEDAMMFVMYFVIASVSGFLISRIRTQQILINQKEKKTSSLYNLTRDLSSSKTLDEVTFCSIKHLEDTFRADVVIIYSESEKKLNSVPHPASSLTIDEAEWNVAQLVYLSSEKIGRFTHNVPSISQATYFPLNTKDRKYGVVGMTFPENTLLDLELESLINTFLSLISVAVEREHLKELSKNNLVIAESEKLYKTLFDSISHELKTPITTIVGAISSLKDEKIIGNRSALSRLIDEANIASERLKRLVENLLDITRLESGNLKLKKEWHSVADLLNSAINRISPDAKDRQINCEIEDEVGIINFDFPLLEQAITNILHNCVEYTSQESMIEVNAVNRDGKIIITIADKGKGFPESEIKNLFKKFYRVPGTKAGGTGLGLSIAKGFIEAHSGTITVQNRAGGGAEFIISLPINK